MSKEMSFCTGANFEILLKFLNKILCSACYLAIILWVGARNVYELMADEAVNVHAKTMKYYLLSNSY